MPHRTPVTFISATGPHLNIGDALIRRQAVRWGVRQSHDVVAYVGSAPKSWERQLEIPMSAEVFRGKSSAIFWIRRVATAPRGSILVFEPGEIPLSSGNVKRELAFLFMTVAFRMRRGFVIRPPRAVRQHATLPRLIHRLACRASTVTLWRDQPSVDLMRIGELSPDIGFAEAWHPDHAATDRGVLVVSMRGDRPYPTAAWISAVRDFARSHDLDVETVTQVLEDDKRGIELAAALGANHLGWDGSEPQQHEERLRERYATTEIVVSDRLHVLILASLSGAIPCELVSDPKPKIQGNFDTIGYPSMSLDADRGTDLVTFLEQQLERRAELTDRLDAAKRQLIQVSDAIAARLPSRNIAQH